jgi:hypothetical protein
MISGTKSVIGRIRPSTEYSMTDSCLIPKWMMRFIYENEDEESGDDKFVEISPFDSLGTASHITLRAHHEADLTSSADPIAMLTEALSSRVCLTVGTELPLSCGVFDVIRICCDSVDVQSGCIMNCDVNLEFVPARDHVETRAETATAETRAEATGSEATGTGQGTSKGTSKGTSLGKNKKIEKFIPFSGVGHKLGS